jgi:hypothetical protein
MPPRCKLPRRSRQLEHNQCHGPFNLFSPFSSPYSEIPNRTNPKCSFTDGCGPPAKLRPTARQVLFLQVLLDEAGAQVNVDLYQR